MNCNIKDRESLIEKYLRKELHESDRIQFEEHFVNCDECFAELESTQQFMELIREEGKELFPELVQEAETASSGQTEFISPLNKTSSPKNIWRPILAYSAAAAILILLGLYLINPWAEVNEKVINDKQMTNKTTDDIPMDDEIPETDDQPEDIKEVEATDLYAANFIESEELEYLIDQRVRSNRDIKIISPANKAVEDDEILFKWETEVEQKFYLKILNNREDVIMKFSTSQMEVMLDPVENDLHPGIYYWKIETEDDLLHLGKFIIPKD